MQYLSKPSEGGFTVANTVLALIWKRTEKGFVQIGKTLPTGNAPRTAVDPITNKSLTLNEMANVSFPQVSHPQMKLRQSGRRRCCQTAKPKGKAKGEAKPTHAALLPQARSAERRVTFKTLHPDDTVNTEAYMSSSHHTSGKH